jgi:Putative abortive phage resistance protein AbiGi, antitoxin
VRVEKVRTWDRKAKKFRTEHDVMRTLESAPVCCLADIPLMHLAYHAPRYGQFALGFHREAALRARFNPVFYTLHESDVIRGIHEGFAKTKATNVDFTQMLLDEVTTITSEAQLTEEVGPYLETLRDDSQDIGKALAMAKTSIEQFLAFVKTFEADEFYSIYCEREWRSVSAFNFTFDDVAMIVLPQRADGRDYFAPFVDGRAKALALPRGIPVVPWETLVES